MFNLFITNKTYNINLCSDLVKLLVEVGGADVKIPDQMGRTPSRRAKEICKMDIVKFLDER